MAAQQPPTYHLQEELKQRSLPSFQHTPLSARFGIDAQLLCDEALRSPFDDLPRIALADTLETKGQNELATYIRISLTRPRVSHAEDLLRRNRQEWSDLFVPPVPIFDEPPVLAFHRGLPSRIMTSGSFIWEGWYCPVTIPVQRILSRYSAPPDDLLRGELSALARYARENREGTGLNEVEILVHTVAPIVERMEPLVPSEDLKKAVVSVIHLLRELHGRGLPSSRCPRSCLGLTMRAMQRELTPSDVQQIAHDILLTIDSVEGRGSIRGAVFEGIIPLVGILRDLRSPVSLRSYLPALTGYVNGLAQVGVPIEPVMRQHFLGFSQGLAVDPSPLHFASLTNAALGRTRRA